MKSGKADKGKTICVMIGDVSFDYALELMSGINSAAAKIGVQLFYMTGKQNRAAPADRNKEHETVSRYNSIYNYANLVGADAYIISFGSLSGFRSDAESRRFLERFDGLNHVVLQKDIGGGPGRCSITIDNYDSYSQLIEHLILVHGLRKIAHVAGPKHHPEASERERAYRDAMEKHGLGVESGMVLYGDLSGFVDEQVENLLTDHPDLDAIAFCNDEMAKTGYRVCEKRGLRVGIDIAITGFDNFATGRSLTPPLTTISQNAYRAGELTLVQAVAMAEGKRAESVRLKTNLTIRSSCGCHRFGDLLIDPDNPAAAGDPRAVIRNMREDLLRLYVRDDQEPLAVLLNDLMDRIESLAFQEAHDPLDELALEAWLSGLSVELKASGALIAERLHGYLMQMADASAHPGMKRLYRVLLLIQGFLFSYESREAAKQFESFKSQAWFVPEFIRDLVILKDEGEGVFLSVVGKLRGIGLDNLYICLLPEPHPLRESSREYIPEKLLLAAYLSGGASGAYPRTKMPVIDKTNPLRDLPFLGSDAHLISFSIFSGDMQYGILLCEANKEKIPLLHVIGLQLGILINFLDLKAKERIVESELVQIREMNEILNFLSEYDSLCNVYNRRGFIEQALRMNHANVGKQAFFAFMDLDHLKEINDNFGHAAGDDAICAASAILKKAIRKNDLIARLGGDEFIGMFILDDPGFLAAFQARIKDSFEAYNLSSEKPYIVDISMGTAEFTCDHGLELSAIIHQADRYLYEAKKHRRTSVLR